MHNFNFYRLILGGVLLVLSIIRDITFRSIFDVSKKIVQEYGYNKSEQLSLFKAYPVNPLKETASWYNKCSLVQVIL